MADRLCAVPGCNKPRYAKGLCNTHYKRKRRTGDVQADRGIGERVTQICSVVAAKTSPLNAAGATVITCAGCDSAMCSPTGHWAGVSTTVAPLKAARTKPRHAVCARLTAF